MKKKYVKPMSIILQMTKESIIYRIKEKLKTYSKKRLAVFYYNLLKNDLPQLKTTKRKALPRLSKFQRTGKKKDMIAGIDYYKDMETLLGTKKPKRKTKRKFSRKQLAAQRLFAKRARAGTLRR